MHAVYYGGPEIGMHDRLKNRHNSNPGPSQRRGPGVSATKKPERSCAALEKPVPQQAQDHEGLRVGREGRPFGLPRRNGEEFCKGWVADRQ